jgi:hypothetical protein
MNDLLSSYGRMVITAAGHMKTLGENPLLKSGPFADNAARGVYWVIRPTIIGI